MAIDDGKGNIYGKCDGSIDYNSGELLLWNTPSKASFEFSVMHSNVWAGAKDATSATKGNTLSTINISNQSEYVSGKVKLTTKE